MTPIPDPSEAPWSLPVPLRPSDFAPLTPQHARFSVETDLARAGGFSLASELPEGLVGYADLQMQAWGNVYRRFGSGRAASFGGAYLKGIGRTQLAANWLDPEDRYHSSGHLLPSAAVRERLVSCLLASLHADDTIVACDGLLFRPLPSGGDFLDRALPEARGQFSPADRHMQAISVKRGDFCRWSNVWWALCWLGHAPGDVVDVLQRWYCALLPEGERAERRAATPAVLASAIEAALQRTWSSFAVWRRLGISWGSLANNLTLDGRFLDLELPCVLGQRFLGLLASPQAPVGRGAWPALEVLREVRRARITIRAVQDRLATLAQSPWISPPIRSYLGDLALALAERLGPGHLLWDDARWEELLLADLSGGLGYEERTVLASAIRRCVAHTLAGQPAPSFEDLDLVPIGPALPPPEPGVTLVCLVPRALQGAHDPSWEIAERWREALRDVERSTSLDALFSSLTRAQSDFALAPREVA